MLHEALRILFHRKLFSEVDCIKVNNNVKIKANDALKIKAKHNSNYSH